MTDLRSSSFNVWLGLGGAQTGNPIQSAPLSSTVMARSSLFDVIQTFYVDSAAVQGAPSVAVSAIDLYFKGRPLTTLNASGITNPGVIVSLCEVVNGIPDLSREFLQVSRLSYDQIFAVADASIATTFGFERPIVVPTDRYYGVVIRFEDSDYSLWTNRRGDAILGTNNPSPGSTASRDGSYFSGSNATLIPQTDVDLKYRVRIAKYNLEEDLDVDLVNKDYEFLTVDQRSSTFVGGENIFIATTQYAGTLNVAAGNTAVTGTGTTLTDLVEGQQFIVRSNNTYSVATVGYVSNTTRMDLVTALPVTNSAAIFYKGPVGQLTKANYVTGQLTLSGSTANTTVKFEGGGTIRGETSNTTANIVSVDNLDVDEFISHIDAVVQSQTTFNSSYEIATSNTTAFFVSNVHAPLPRDVLVGVGSEPRAILSRSNEVDENYLYSTDLKSANVRLTLGSTNQFVSPIVEDINADLTVRQVQISNTTSHLAAGLDTEIGSNGKSLSKHFTRKLTFEGDRQAEDLKVFASIYRPAGTEVRVYAKLYNNSDSEAFDDKPWTPLEIKNNRANIRSSTEALQYIEYEFGLPAHPEVKEELAGTFTVVDDNATITGFGTADLTTKVAVGDKIKVFSPLFPNTNYIVATVASRTSTTITFAENITDNNVVGVGMKASVLLYNTAFSNPSNFFTTRYYNSTGAAFDKFNVAQLKIVLQSDRSNIIPRVSQVQMIGVSA